jgi:Zn-dependent M28 family amino/carboxypeptidase
MSRPVRSRLPILFIISGALTAGVVLVAASSKNTVISAERMLAHVNFLASDKLEGRAPGSPGEQKAVTYLTEQLTQMGCEPGNPDGTYVQKVPMYGFEVINQPSLVVRGNGGVEKQFAAGKEFVGWTLRQTSEADVRNAEMVFVGYGVEAPEFQWNDYKTAVRGKVIVMLVNDPPMEDATLFGGKAMTYYGRWTYKFEKAAAMGAIGAILVHNTNDAGYPWEVVENSWSGEQFDVVRTDRGDSRCAFEAWITEAAARDLFTATGRSFDDDKRAACAREFQPAPLNLTASTEIKTRSRLVESNNVVAKVSGTGPQAGEFIIYSAHWDHLGVGKPAEGDSIYNGALDNASGVAGVMEIARALAAHDRPLKRSTLFLFTTGEESGLLGATHYTNHPLYPLEKTIAEINVDGLNIWGRTEDMVVVGYGQSDLEQTLAEALAPMNRRIAPDSEPEKGYYYRSDHFPFAKKGVPALYSDSGVEYRDRPAGWGLERRKEYVAQRYHKPQDELTPSWDLSGAAEDMEALYKVGMTLANREQAPQWSEKSEFRRVRQAMASEPK